MKPFDETDLAAYHLGDLPSPRARLLEKALRTDANLAAESEVYASMLRNFKDHASLEVDEDTVERNWQRIQYRLPRYSAPVPFSSQRLVAFAATGLTLVAAVFYVYSRSVVRVFPPTEPMAVAPTARPLPPPTVGEPPAVVLPVPSHHRQSFSIMVRRSRLIAMAELPEALIARNVDSPRVTSPSKDAVPALRSTPSAPPSLPLVSSAPSVSNEPASNAPMSESGTTNRYRRNGPARHHEHTTDVTLAMGGVLIPARSLDAGSATQVAGASHAVSALGSFHQQWRPLAGYRATLSYSRPDFNFENSSYGGVHINARIYEVAGTYVVQGLHRGFLSTAVEAGAGLMTILPTDNTSYTRTDRRVAAIAGATAEIALSKHVALHAGYRLQVFHAPNFQVSSSAFPLPTPVVASTLFSNEPSLGLTYHFFRK